MIAAMSLTIKLCALMMTCSRVQVITSNLAMNVTGISNASLDCIRIRQCAKIVSSCTSIALIALLTKSSAVKAAMDCSATVAPVVNSYIRIAPPVPTRMPSLVESASIWKREGDESSGPDYPTLASLAQTSLKEA